MKATKLQVYKFVKFSSDILQMIENQSLTHKLWTGFIVKVGILDF